MDERLYQYYKQQAERSQEVLKRMKNRQISNYGAGGEIKMATPVTEAIARAEALVRKRKLANQNGDGNPTIKRQSVSSEIISSVGHQTVKTSQRTKEGDQKKTTNTKTNKKKPRQKKITRKKVKSRDIFGD